MSLSIIRLMHQPGPSSHLPVIVSVSVAVLTKSVLPSQYEEEIRQLHVQMEQLHSRLSEELPRPAVSPVPHVCQPTPGQISDILHRSVTAHPCPRPTHVCHTTLGQISDILHRSVTSRGTSHVLLTCYPRPIYVRPTSCQRAVRVPPTT